MKDVRYYLRKLFPYNSFLVLTLTFCFFLSPQLNGQWLYAESSSQLTTPSLGSVLTSSTVTFEWEAVSGATEYYLGIGTSANSVASYVWGDIYHDSQGTRTTATINGIPINGNPVYVRLWTFINAQWLYQDYVYQTSQAVGPPQPDLTVVAFGWPTSGGKDQELNFTYQVKNIGMATAIGKYWGGYYVKMYVDNVKVAERSHYQLSAGGSDTNGFQWKATCGSQPSRTVKIVVDDGNHVDNESNENNNTVTGQLNVSGCVSSIWRPAPGTTWQWQLQGAIDTSFNVQVYDIDLFDVPQSVIDQLHQARRKVICYLSAGTFEPWREDAHKFPEQVKGKPLDPPFGTEKWLDIRRIDILGPIMQARLQLAKDKRCDAVEPDNVDGYTNNSGFPLTAQNQLDYNRWLAAEAHKRGLSVGLKNDVDQVAQLQPDFDWALNEQCFEYAECATLRPFIQAGKAVFGVEYGNPDNPNDQNKFLSDVCPSAKAEQFSWLLKDLDLDARRFACP